MVALCPGSQDEDKVPRFARPLKLAKAFNRNTGQLVSLYTWTPRHLAGVLPIGLVILVFDKTKDNPRLYFKKMVL
jgi:hypothetical protein